MTESAEALVRRIEQHGFTKFRRTESRKWIYVKRITKREYERAK